MHNFTILIKVILQFRKKSKYLNPQKAAKLNYTDTTLGIERRQIVLVNAVSSLLPVLMVQWLFTG